MESVAHTYLIGPPVGANIQWKIGIKRKKIWKLCFIRLCFSMSLLVVCIHLSNHRISLFHRKKSFHRDRTRARERDKKCYSGVFPLVFLWPSNIHWIYIVQVLFCFKNWLALPLLRKCATIKSFHGIMCLIFVWQFLKNAFFTFGCHNVTIIWLNGNELPLSHSFCRYDCQPCLFLSLHRLHERENEIKRSFNTSSEKVSFKFVL